MEDFEVVDHLRPHRDMPVRIEIRVGGGYALSDGDFIFENSPDEVTRLVTVNDYYEGIDQEFILPGEIQALKYK